MAENFEDVVKKLGSSVKKPSAVKAPTVLAVQMVDSKGNVIKEDKGAAASELKRDQIKREEKTNTLLEAILKAAGGPGGPAGGVAAKTGITESGAFAEARGKEIAEKGFYKGSFAAFTGLIPGISRWGPALLGGRGKEWLGFAGRKGDKQENENNDYLKRIADAIAPDDKGAIKLPKIPGLGLGLGGDKQKEGAAGAEEEREEDKREQKTNILLSDILDSVRGIASFLGALGKGDGKKGGFFSSLLEGILSPKAIAALGGMGVLGLLGIGAVVLAGAWAAVEAISDGILGLDWAKRVGIEDETGFIAKFFGGDEEGGIWNSIAQGIKGVGVGATVGLAFGGPVGMVAGALIGGAIFAIAGAFGAKEIADWIDPLVQKLKTLFGMAIRVTPEELDDAKKKSKELLEVKTAAAAELANLREQLEAATTEKEKQELQRQIATAEQELARATTKHAAARTQQMKMDRQAEKLAVTLAEDAIFQNDQTIGNLETTLANSKAWGLSTAAISVAQDDLNVALKQRKDLKIEEAAAEAALLKEDKRLIAQAIAEGGSAPYPAHFNVLVSETIFETVEQAVDELKGMGRVLHPDVVEKLKKMRNDAHHRRRTPAESQVVNEMLLERKRELEQAAAADAVRILRGPKSPRPVPNIWKTELNIPGRDDHPTQFLGRSADTELEKEAQLGIRRWATLYASQTGGGTRQPVKPFAALSRLLLRAAMNAPEVQLAAKYEAQHERHLDAMLQAKGWDKLHGKGEYTSINTGGNVVSAPTTNYVSGGIAARRAIYLGSR